MATETLNLRLGSRINWRALQTAGRISTFGLFLLGSVPVLALPPGAQLGEFGPKQMAVSAFFDHNGLTLFESPATAMLNTAGLTAEFAPWRFIQLGVSMGASEMDISVSDSRAADTSVHAFNGDYGLMGGGDIKLATPRFFSDAIGLVAYGNATWFDVKDASSNKRRGFYYQGGASLQWAFMNRCNLALGAEYHALDGEQENAQGKVELFGLNAATDLDAIRGLIGFDYTFPQKNHPFISVVFRPTGAIGWDDRLGLKNASIAISFGATTDLGGKSNDPEEHSGSPIED